MITGTKTEAEINEQIDIAAEKRDNGEGFTGMSYEDGVIAALDWVSGMNSEKPMDD